ncbi:hypothetical protein [Acidaminococcus timonensis]|uniref:hypothetical protein n=1 Tax=Acidaminococcus timonensis TaxID=1871002 RepID=UPI0029434F01|nr:hypothetical protein [Acidaminococcus timonensis]
MRNKDDDAIKNSGFPDWYRWIAAALLIFCLGFGCGFGIGHHTGAGVYDDAERAGKTQQQLERAQEQQQTITAGSESAAQRAGDVEERITRGQEAVQRAEEAAGSVDDGLKKSGDLIGDSQQVLDGIRQRGEKDPATH